MSTKGLPAITHRRQVALRVVPLLVPLVLFGSAGTLAMLRIRAATPAPALSITAGVTLDAAAGTPPPIPLPAGGSFAIADSLGAGATSNATQVRPIASVAKAMTALVVLGVKPLSVGADGPVVTMGATDVALYRQALAQNGSSLFVSAGERLSERDLLLGLMLPSANNIAESLALWVSGTRTAFITRLNAVAAAMGMAHTRFADPSGVSAKTVSTAADLVILARAVIANPVLAAIVSTASATLPDGTVLQNLDILLGSEPGWAGIKTGWTPGAGGCLLFADQRPFAGTPSTVTVYGAVLGQPQNPAADAGHPELGGAFVTAKAAAEADLGGYAAVDLSAVMPEFSGSIATAWGDGSSVAIGPVSTARYTFALGTTLDVTLRTSTLTAPPFAGQRVGTLTGSLHGMTVMTWPLVAATSVPQPTWWWKLVNA